MNVNDAKILSRRIMEAGEVPLLVGHFGVGKTDLARELARESSRELTILILSQMEPGDLLGLPSRENERTVFLKPDWWPETGQTLILLDEINRAHRSIRNAVMQLLIDRRIHNHVLPDGTWLMATMNPPDEEYDQADLITDPAFVSRFFILDVSPAFNEWSEWARERNVSKDVMGFLSKYPEFLYTPSPVSLRIELRPSPRSWYKLSRVLDNLTPDEKTRYAYHLAAGILGPEAAKAFVDYSTYGFETPLPRKILVEGISQTLQKHNIDSASSVVVRLIDYLSKVDDEEVAMLRTHLKRVAKNISDLSSVIPRESFYALIRFIVDKASNSEDSSDFFDSLVEELSTHSNVRSVLEGI